MYLSLNAPSYSSLYSATPNQAISKVRVEVEHHIGGIKRCQIVVQKFRNWVDHYVDDVMETACGLHNLRLTHRQKRLATPEKVA